MRGGSSPRLVSSPRNVTSGSSAASARARSVRSAPNTTSSHWVSVSMVTCSATESRAFSGTRLIPPFTQAKSSGTLSRLLFSSSPTRRPCPAPSRARACASRLLSSSTSANVISSSPNTTAVRSVCWRAPRMISSRVVVMGGLLVLETSVPARPGDEPGGPGRALARQAGAPGGALRAERLGEGQVEAGVGRGAVGQDALEREGRDLLGQLPGGVDGLPGLDDAVGQADREGLVGPD